MKHLLLGLCCSTFLLADTIYIQPGSEISLTPGQPVTVRCQGTSETHFCRCVLNEQNMKYDLVRTHQVGSEFKDIKLAEFYYVNDCNVEMKSHPACR